MSDPSSSESRCVTNGPSSDEEDDQALSPSEEASGNAGKSPPFLPTKDAPKDANYENDLSNIRQRRDEDKRKGRAVSKQLVSPVS